MDAGRGRRLAIGFIHLTAIGTESFPGSYQPGLRTLDELETANRCAAELKSRGVHAIVLSMHDGAVAGSDFSSGKNPSGPAYELALRASPDIDAIVTGHWHCAFTMMLPDPNGDPRPFVEAGCYGQIINEINLRLDPDTGSVVRELTTSVNHPNTREVTPDPELRSIAGYWAGYATRRARSKIGTQTASFTRRRNAVGESTMGNLVADWALWAGRQPRGPMDDPAQHPNTPADLAVIAVAPRVGQAVIAGDLIRDGETDGTVTFAQAWNSVGFGDPILTVTVTGRQIHDALEEQWAPTAGGGLGFSPLAVSANVRYTFDAAGQVGRRIDPAEVFIDGTALDIDPQIPARRPLVHPHQPGRLQRLHRVHRTGTAHPRLRELRRLRPRQEAAEARPAEPGGGQERGRARRPHRHRHPAPAAAPARRQRGAAARGGAAYGADRRRRGPARPRRLPGALLTRSAGAARTNGPHPRNGWGPALAEGQVRRPWPWWRTCRRTPGRTAP